VPALTRPQLCGRIQALRTALDLLEAQEPRSGPYRLATAAVRAELEVEEARLRRYDRWARDTTTIRAFGATVRRLRRPSEEVARG
jgi:hypothetical protein